MTRMDELTIKECVKKTQELLEEHWAEIKTVRHENPNEKIKVGLDFNLSFKNDEQLIRTTISFGMRKNDHRDSVVNPNQLEFPIGNGNGEDGDSGAPTDGPVSIDVPKKKRARNQTLAAATSE